MRWQDTDKLIEHMLELHHGDAKGAIAWLLGALGATENKRVSALQALGIEADDHLIKLLIQDMDRRQKLEATK